MLSITIDPIILTTLLIATGIFALWNRIFKQRILSKKPFPSLPMPKGNTALMGHIALIANNTDPSAKHLVRDYADERGRTGFWIGNKPALAVTHWEDARAILQAESNRDAPFVQRQHVGHMTGSNSILLLNGREWKIHRAAVSAIRTLWKEQSRSHPLSRTDSEFPLLRRSTRHSHRQP